MSTETTPLNRSGNHISAPQFAVLVPSKPNRFKVIAKDVSDEENPTLFQVKVTDTLTGENALSIYRKKGLKGFLGRIFRTHHVSSSKVKDADPIFIQTTPLEEGKASQKTTIAELVKGLNVSKKTIKKHLLYAQDHKTFILDPKYQDKITEKRTQTAEKIQTIVDELQNDIRKLTEKRDAAVDTEYDGVPNQDEGWEFFNFTKKVHRTLPRQTNRLYKIKSDPDARELHAKLTKLYKINVESHEGCKAFTSGLGDEIKKFEEEIWWEPMPVINKDE